MVSGWIPIKTSAVQMRPFCAPQTGSWSGPQDDPPTAAARLGRLHLGQGDLQVASGCGSVVDHVVMAVGQRAIVES